MKKKTEVIVENIIKSPLNDLISDRYGDYAKYIIQERALPDARDGLKPVQRRILYAMNKDGNTFERSFRKSAKTVGLVIGNYHPHGDSSVYEAMVRLSQDWKINYPLVQMHGNNGSIDDDPAAAMRYTEARLAEISGSLLEDIDKDTINWTPNFDDTENEPTVLPAKFPNLLVNGSTGIASGYATEIPPHNLNEVIDGAIYRINNPDCSLEELMQFIKGPDFPTKGIVMGLQGIKDAFTTGKGKVVVRSKVTIEQTKTCQQIIATEIPYGVVKTNIVKKMDEIRFNGDVNGILDVRDESDRNGLRIVVDVHKDIDANNVLNYLYKNTQLQVNYNYNMVAIVNNRPTLLSLAQALDSYIEFDKEVVLRRSNFEFNKRLKRCHILEGLIKAVSVMDEVIKIIRSSKDKANAKERLIKKFGFSEEQAEAIVVLRLYRLTNTDVYALKSEYEQLVEELKELKEIISNPAKLNETICKELSEVKNRFGKERGSVIEREVEEITIDKTSMIANERVMVTLSNHGYVKKVSLRSYNAAGDNLTGLKDEDLLIGAIECDTLDTIVAFTQSGEYLILPVYKLVDSKWKDVGKHISDYVTVNNSEKFIAAYIVKDFNTYAYFISASKNGMIKKTLVSKFVLQRTSKSSACMVLEGDDEVVSVKLAYANSEVALITKDGYSSRYSIDEIPEVNNRAKGVKSVKLSENDYVADFTVISLGKSEMVYLSDKGNSKRIKLADIPVTKRATKGISITKKVKTNPTVITKCIAASIGEDLKIISDGAYLPLKAKDITILSADSRFSASTIANLWYHYEGIEEVKIIDIPEQDDHPNFEELRLEV